MLMLRCGDFRTDSCSNLWHALMITRRCLDSGIASEAATVAATVSATVARASTAIVARVSAALASVILSHQE